MVCVGECFSSLERWFSCWVQNCKVMDDYHAETTEALTLARNTRVLVLFPGEDWTFVEHDGQKGFLPTPLLKVNGTEDVLTYCRRNGIPVAPLGSSSMSESVSEKGRSKDLAQELHIVRSGLTGAATTSGAVSAAGREKQTNAVFFFFLFPLLIKLGTVLVSAKFCLFKSSFATQGLALKSCRIRRRSSPNQFGLGSPRRRSIAST